MPAPDENIPERGDAQGAHAGAPGAAEPAARPGLARRCLLLRGGLAVGVGAVAGGVGTGFAVRASADEASASSSLSTTEPFWGANQSGIVTDTQRNTVLAAFDLNTSRRADVVALLKSWTALAAQITAGQNVTVPIFTFSGADDADAYADATNASTTDDSLEAYGLGPARLTLTIGFGRSLFVDSSGNDRFGISHQLPDALLELPHFSGDQLTASDSDGDLYLQACADDPQVAFHAVRSIARIAPDVAALRWTQLGFSPSNTGGTPRNLMGFKDGTINSNAHPPADPQTVLWAGSEGPAWMSGGSYLVYRRIRMALEHWDRLEPSDQEQVIGRRKLTGAPLGEAGEFDALDLDAKGPGGQPVIPATAHVRLAAPQANNGAVIVRRAFSYNNGTTAFVERWPPWRQALEYDAGLLFLGYQRDPRTAFVPMFTKMAEYDALNQFTTHTASAVFAIPPGASGPGDWVGRSLFG
jgi:deferrochelatase/peroxidase EfeB